MRRIIYVSGTRADYGLMAETLKFIDQKKSLLSLEVCVTGMHLLEQYGSTVNEIVGDGLSIAGSIHTDLDARSGESMAIALSDQLKGMTKLFAQKKPDFVMLLGDRGEMLAAAIAALHLNIPIIHIHGGERSGSVDEPVRHAISKLAHYHFTATNLSKERLIKMGEKPDNIFVTGAPGLVGIGDSACFDKEVLFENASLNPDLTTALVVFHPVVQDASSASNQISVLLECLKTANIQCVCLAPNSDAGGKNIKDIMEAHAGSEKIRLYTHFQRKYFLSWMKHASFMIGNSSSGIIEAACFDLPVINVGDRQKGRERSSNAIDVQPHSIEINDAISLVRKTGKRQTENVYGDGNAHIEIAELVTHLPINRELLNKINEY